MLTMVSLKRTVLAYFTIRFENVRHLLDHLKNCIWMIEKFFKKSSDGSLQENMPETPIFFLVNKSDIDEEAAVLDADSDSEERKPRISECANHSSSRVGKL